MIDDLMILMVDLDCFRSEFRNTSSCVAGCRVGGLERVGMKRVPGRRGHRYVEDERSREEERACLAIRVVIFAVLGGWILWVIFSMRNL